MSGLMILTIVFILSIIILTICLVYLNDMYEESKKAIDSNSKDLLRLNDRLGEVLGHDYNDRVVRMVKPIDIRLLQLENDYQNLLDKYNNLSEVKKINIERKIKDIKKDLEEL